MFLTIIAIIFVSFFTFPVYALEDVPPAVPPPVVEAQSLPLSEPASKSHKAKPKPKPKENSVAITKPKKAIKNISKGVYVLELFSSQACTFCPKADAMIKAYIDQPYMIALSCHVDYFDVKEGARSLPICSARQNSYEESLNIGNKYIPQMVVNGKYNATGYLTNEIAKAFKLARPNPISSISVRRGKGRLYSAILPDIEAGQYNIWLFVYENPLTIKVQEGGNAGKMLTYYNLVSKAGFLGSWDGAAKELKFDAKLGKNSKGFALIIQNIITNEIALAAKME